MALGSAECYDGASTPAPATTSAPETTTAAATTTASQFMVGYYNKKCGSTNVEQVVYQIVQKHYIDDKDTVADLIRLQFHDCMVNGCDASILVEGSNTEKTAVPNQSVSGYEVIEEIKVALDNKCPGVVSCADLIVLAARSAVYLGGANWYDVETGRKDGRVSLASLAEKYLPGAAIPIPQALKAFAKLGINTKDFVLLLGCHTVGTAHCNNFKDRLYNYNGYPGKSDPYMASTLLATLKKTCPKDASTNNEAFLDQTPGSEDVMDNAFYKDILAGKGILQVDQMMAIDSSTKGFVQALASDPSLFPAQIGPAMRKLAKAGVLLQGEVRLGTCKKIR